jgi:hypothetical protein
MKCGVMEAAGKRGEGAEARPTGGRNENGRLFVHTWQRGDQVAAVSLGVSVDVLAGIDLVDEEIGGLPKGK